MDATLLDTADTARRKQLISTMAPRVLKRHLLNDERPTPKTTKRRKLKREKVKGQVSYKNFLRLGDDVPRSTTYRRKLFNQVFQLDVSGNPQLEREEVDAPLPTEPDNEERDDLFDELCMDIQNEDGYVDEQCVDIQNEDSQYLELGNDRHEYEILKQSDTHIQEMDNGQSECQHGIEHGLDEPVYDGSLLTKAQSLLLIMAFVLRHNLTGVALQDLLNLLNEHIPGVVPKTSFLFHKAYGQFGEYLPHIYCINCEMYLGPRDKIPALCPSCKAEIDFEDSVKAGSFFLVMSLSEQLRELLKKSKLETKKNVPDIISDIQSGVEYQKLLKSGQMGHDDISLLWNCDGIPVFKSNNIQIWPIQCQIIELSPKERQQNICIPCLWFGKSKPNMITYLTAFVSQLKELEETGLKWTDSKNLEHTSRVHALICSSDSIARPLLRNAKQFNGKYGCDFCLHPGGGPYVRKRPEPALRTAESHFEHAMQASADEPVMGVKGPSPLMELKIMNMVTSFIPEYQHSVCLGVTKQITSLWLDSKHHKEDWYVGSKVSDIDKQLLEIMPPVEVTRVPRSIVERKFWKASEWRSFLLFYALPVLNGILKTKYINHLFLLIFAMHTLLQDVISVKHIDTAEQALRKFVFDFERLYGAVNASFNVHLLLHLATSVRNWGPLWATSTFPFESFNGTLLKFFSGTTYIPEQIVKKFLRWRCLEVKANSVMANATGNVKDLFLKLQGSSRYVKKSKKFPTGVRGFGHPKRKNTSILQRKAIEYFTSLSIHSGLFYNRFTCNGVLYHSCNNTTLKKRNNAVVQLEDGRYCEILTLIEYNNPVSGENTGFCVLVKELCKSEDNIWRDVQLKISSTFITKVLKTSSVFAVNPLSLKRKCVMFGSLNELFVIPLPNNIERD